ncbi:MAG: glycoside hydrolase family 127 protein [Candidatus Pacebacteria bacterium]|nr:glycoside hydrolase family 127 protein [Candidatus Paceibacterota bacterium]
MKRETYKYAVSRPLATGATMFTGGFWKERTSQSRNRGLPAVLTEYEQRNIVKNFVDAAKGRPRARKENGNNYDEFLFKALEACNWHLGKITDDALEDQYERIRDIVLAAQQSDGYLNTLAIQTGTPHHSPQTHQELYAGGHLMQAGIAERRATGKSVLFDAARRYIDCLIEGYGLDGQGFCRKLRSKWPDHPNIEMALVELYRETADPRYLEFCKSVLDFGGYQGRTQMLSHAVREMLCSAAGADYYLETGDMEVWAATKRLWTDLLKKVYVTGGVGSTHRGTGHESVGKEFALTNDQSYAETCAAIGLIFWSWRMFLATGEAEYTDMFERVLYNGFLAGMSLSGCEYFYENPLEYRAVSVEGSVADSEYHADFRGARARRAAFHRCSCCPPNVQRLLASLEQYVYSVSDAAVWVNLFAASEANIVLGNGTMVTLSQHTDYPQNGRVAISVGLDAATDFSLNVRIPEWSRDSRVIVNDEAVSTVAAGTYLSLDRTWRDGDNVTLELNMTPRLVQCHPKNIANYEKVVIARGPVIYCIEATDNPGIDIFSLVTPTNIEFDERVEDTLGHAVVLDGKALERDDSGWGPVPYQAFDSKRKPPMKPVGITAVPYYAWANRDKASMVTALPYVADAGS